ncbi:uncharacterized protein LOC120643831 isoform X2 [Panicum virgatum]|uniref:uncharacterized protein LOC120643831 isoform X2 n=1 Tax=Panicum virgatum TaxID=38727 RepID=UPI0019D5160A|nr:uncharacterized protein LOC120643831 isoform X2 [Panicum virgatum]
MAGAGAGASPGADPAASGWKVWFRAKAQSSFDALTTIDYEREEVGKTARQIRDMRRAKLRGYFAICMLGLGTMHWGGAQKVLDHMNKGEGNKELVNICVRFLTFSFNCSLLGLTAVPSGGKSCKLFILHECFAVQFALVLCCSGSTDFACCWQDYHIIYAPPFVPDKLDLVQVCFWKLVSQGPFLLWKPKEHASTN